MPENGPRPAKLRPTDATDLAEPPAKSHRNPEMRSGLPRFPHPARHGNRRLQPSVPAGAVTCRPLPRVLGSGVSGLLGESVEHV